jgi:hypothetical protein
VIELTTRVYPPHLEGLGGGAIQPHDGGFTGDICPRAVVLDPLAWTVLHVASGEANVEGGFLPRLDVPVERSTAQSCPRRRLGLQRRVTGASRDFTA